VCSLDIDKLKAKEVKIKRSVGAESKKVLKYAGFFQKYFLKYFLISLGTLIALILLFYG